MLHPVQLFQIYLCITCANLIYIGYIMILYCDWAHFRGSNFIVSSPVQMYRQSCCATPSLPHQLKFYFEVYFRDGQGAVTRAILYVDRPCFQFSFPSQRGSAQKRIGSFWRRFFPLRADPYCKGLVTQESKQEVTKVVSLENISIRGCEKPQ